MCGEMAPEARRGLSSAEKYPRGVRFGPPRRLSPGADLAQPRDWIGRQGDGPAMDETMDKIIGASNSPTISMLCLGGLSCPRPMPYRVWVSSQDASESHSGARW